MSTPVYRSAYRKEISSVRQPEKYKILVSLGPSPAVTRQDASPRNMGRKQAQKTQESYIRQEEGDSLSGS